MQHIKRTYVSAMHGLGSRLYGSGMLRSSPAAHRSDLARWLHSLFAIYDIDAMVRLDLPWWTLRSVRLIDIFLAGRLQPRVFEYGSGASTIFLGRRAAQVLSVEHDPDWYGIVSRRVAAQPNITLDLIEAVSGDSSSGYSSGHPDWQGYDFRDYVHALDRQEGFFDLIVIDGRCRSQCLHAALCRIKSDGIILFDNAGRRRYRTALKSMNLESLSTAGLTACLPYSDSTVLLSPTPSTLAMLAAN